LPNFRGPEAYRFEFLPEVQEEVQPLSEELRRRIAELVVELHENPWLGELMDDRWPANLEGSRKLRFDIQSWKGKPRFRLVYRNEPTDGAVGVIVVLAIERREDMIAYAKASARLTRRRASESRAQR
jgi:mRNA-degrading endonuclease RelE of RelBE toxin-antitoxin system